MTAHIFACGVQIANGEFIQYHPTTVKLRGKNMLMSALGRKESRGAHFRGDYPTENDSYQKQTIAEYRQNKIRIWFEKAVDFHED